AGGVLWQHQHRGPPARLLDVGPRMVSNQTSQPLQLLGENLRPGLKLHLSAPFSRTVPMTVVDARHAYARIPADLTIAPDTVQVSTVLSVEGEAAPSEVSLTVVNDAAYPDYSLLVGAGDLLWAASTPTDTLLRIAPDSGTVTRFDGGDGPSAVASWLEPGGHPMLAGGGMEGVLGGERELVRGGLDR